MAYDNCGDLSISCVAWTGSLSTKFCICTSISRSWVGGRVVSVLDMLSVALRPCSRSLPGGKGGNRLDAACPSVGAFCC